MRIMMCQIVRPQKVLLFGCVFPKLKKKKKKKKKKTF